MCLCLMGAIRVLCFEGERKGERITRSSIHAYAQGFKRFAGQMHASSNFDEMKSSLHLSAEWIWGLGIERFV